MTIVVDVLTYLGLLDNAALAISTRSRPSPSPVKYARWIANWFFKIWDAALQKVVLLDIALSTACFCPEHLVHMRRIGVMVIRTVAAATA
jgi:hypothetical protein